MARRYEIYDPSQNYLHTNVTMPGKAKFMATSTEGLIGLNYGTVVKAGDAAVNGQMVCFTSADLQSRSTSNPQPIGFRGNLLVKRQKFFYCTYSLGITETS